MSSAQVLRTVVVAGAFATSVVLATPAHAIVFAVGAFSDDGQLGGVCVETYGGTSVGIASCGARLVIGSFAVVVNHRDGTCSGAARATLDIDSPSTPSAPDPVGWFVVSHGAGSFSGSASDGVIVSIGRAEMTGAICKPENVLGSWQTMKGAYELHG